VPLVDASISTTLFACSVMVCPFEITVQAKQENGINVVNTKSSQPVLVVQILVVWEQS
jgi:hypothetical protein